jgi:hypothetical protein
MNAYNTAFSSRIAAAAAKNSTSSNVQRLKRCDAIVSQQAVETMLERCNVSAERLLRAMYATFKAVELVAAIFDHKDANLEKNTVAMLRTVINLKRENMLFTKADAKASISRDYKTTDEKQNVIFVRSAILDEKTVNAQHQTSIDALLTLNILKEHATLKDTYEIELNEIAYALAKKLEIDMSAFETSEDENEDAA